MARQTSEWVIGSRRSITIYGSEKAFFVPLTESSQTNEMQELGRVTGSGRERALKLET